MLMYGAGELGDEGFAAAEQAAPEQGAQRQVGAEVLYEKKQCDVFAQGWPIPHEAAKHGEHADAGQQQVAAAPEQQAEGSENGGYAEQYREVGRAFAGASAMGQQSPDNEKDDNGQAAQQLARGQGHFVRWEAIWVVRARSDEKMRRLSSLSDLS